MNDGENDDGEQRSQDPENGYDLGDQGQSDQHQGYAAQGEFGNPQATMLAFVMGLRGLAGFEPPNIFSSWIVARFRDRILHEIHNTLVRPREDLPTRLIVCLLMEILKLAARLGRSIILPKAKRPRSLAATL